MNYEDNFIFQHFRWIFNLISRLKKGSMNLTPLLSLDFIKKQYFPEIVSLFPDFTKQNTQTSPPSAIHYAILTYYFTKSDNINEIKDHIKDNIFLYQYTISKLSSIGYKPCNPCNPDNLENESLADHINLCMCLEFVVSDKSLTIENLLDDIRRLPRSFFVLSSPRISSNSNTSDNFYYPANLEEAVRLWFSKFPCLYELPDLTQRTRTIKKTKSLNLPTTIKNNSNFRIVRNSIENLQDEIRDGKHIIAVLSRSFPNRISKEKVLQGDFESNWKMVRSILEDEIGAFVPSYFPVSDNLFMCFVSDLFHATRNGAKKFVKIDDHKLNRNFINHSNTTPIRSVCSFNLPINESCSVACNGSEKSSFASSNSFSKQAKIGSVGCLTYTTSTIRQPQDQQGEVSLKDNNDEHLNANSGYIKCAQKDVNSVAASIVFRSSNRRHNSVNRSVKQTVTASGIKPPTNFTNSDEEEFLKLYQILNDSFHFFNTELTDSSVHTIAHSLAKLLHSKNDSDKTFKKLKRILQSKKQNGAVFENAVKLVHAICKSKTPIKSPYKIDLYNDGFGLGEIDLNASQKVIEFARTMILNGNLNEPEKSALKRVIRQGFSISTQTSSMTHSMSFVRDSKSVKVTAYVNVKKSLSELNEFELKSISTQTECSPHSCNNRTSWKNSEKVVKFETVSYPYGESKSAFIRPNSANYSSFRKTINYNSGYCSNYKSNRKCSSFSVDGNDDKYDLIRNISQKI